MADQLLKLKGMRKKAETIGFRRGQEASMEGEAEEPISGKKSEEVNETRHKGMGRKGHTMDTGT